MMSFFGQVSRYAIFLGAAFEFKKTVHYLLNLSSKLFFIMFPEVRWNVTSPVEPILSDLYYYYA